MLVNECRLRHRLRRQWLNDLVFNSHDDCVVANLRKSFYEDFLGLCIVNIVNNPNLQTANVLSITPSYSTSGKLRRNSEQLAQVYAIFNLTVSIPRDKRIKIPYKRII